MAQQVTSDLLLANIQQYAQNPPALVRTMMVALEQASNGSYYLVDPGNPFVFLMEASCMLAAAGVIQNRATARELYPSLATAPEELYRHMSDKDHLGQFATPAKTTITFWLSYDEVVSKAVPMSQDPLAIRKLTIARNTRVLAGGYPLMMLYPVDIKIMPSGGCNVVMDTNISSPFWQPPSNRLIWNIRTIAGRKYFAITVPFWQMNCDTQINALNAVTGFSKTFNFSNSFYYARCFIKNDADTTWLEIKTTHTDQVFDPNSPTAVLSVDTVNGLLGVSIPQIYFNTGLIKSQLRVDIYTTNGDINLSLINFAPESYVAKWVDLDDPSTSIYRAPLNSFSDLTIRSDDVITGGADGKDFATLRAQVVENALDTPLVPLSIGGLQNALASDGFNMVVNVDNITQREIIATRLLPTPKSETTGSGIGAMVGTALVRLQDWALNDGVSNNGARMTVKPNALFDLTDGTLRLVPSDLVASMKNPAITTPDNLILDTNSHTYGFTPFYYVLDVQSETFDIRPYRLDNPKITSQFFIKENPTAGIDVASDAMTLSFISDGSGYRLIVEVDTDANSIWQGFDPTDTFAQLSYIDSSTGVRHHLTGTQITAIDPGTARPVGGIYQYQFDLTTVFDIDSDHNLRLTTAGNGLVALDSTFDLVFIVKNWLPQYTGFTDLDTLVDPVSIPGYVSTDVYLAVAHEQIAIHFGDFLGNLWRRCRSIVGDTEYVLNTGPTTYSYYDKPIYQLDPTTGQIAVTWDSGTSTLVRTVLHYAGDPIIPVPTTLTDTAAATAGDTTISFTTSTFTLDPTKRYAFTLWGAGTGGATLVGTMTAGVTAGTVVLSVPVVTSIAAGAKFVYGEQEILAATGQPAKDVNGNLIPVSTRPASMKREFDMLLLDGRYYFATDEQSAIDKKEAVDYITAWVNEDLADIAQRLLERTELYYFPTVTMGAIQAIGPGSQPVQVNAEQKLTVTYYLTADRYNNEDLRTALENSAPVVIASALANRTVSRALIERQLKDAAGSDAVSIEVSGFNSDGAQTLTFSDQLTRPTIAKQLTLTASGTLLVTESVNVVFEKYDDTIV